MARRNSKRGKGEGTLFKRKDGKWQGAITVGYDENGKQRRKTVYGKTQAEVIGKLDKVKGQLANGTFSDTRITVSQFMAQYLNHKKVNVEERTHQFYKDYVRLYIEPHIGRVELAKLTSLHVQNMMKEVAEAVSKDAANKARTVLNTALKWAVAHGLIARNPADAVAKLR